MLANWLSFVCSSLWPKHSSHKLFADCLCHGKFFFVLHKNLTATKIWEVCMHEIVSKLKSNVYVIYTNWRTCNLIRGIIVRWEYIQAFMWIWWNGYLNPVPWTSLTRLQFFSLGLRGLQLRLSGRDVKNCCCQLRVAVPITKVQLSFDLFFKLRRWFASVWKHRQWWQFF